MTRIKTMCVGDSITMGSDLRGGYRRPLNNLAPNLDMVGPYCVDGTYGYTVGQHAGISGATISAIRSAILPVVDTYTPALVLLMAGTNDISVGTDAATALSDYLTLAEELLAKSSVTMVIAATIAPRLSTTGGYAGTVAFNAGLSAAFAGASPGITAYDVSRDLVASVHLADTVHPTEDGYAVMASGWWRALVSLSVTTTVDALGRTLGAVAEA